MDLLPQRANVNQQLHSTTAQQMCPIQYVISEHKFLTRTTWDSTVLKKHCWHIARQLKLSQKQQHLAATEIPLRFAQPMSEGLLLLTQVSQQDPFHLFPSGAGSTHAFWSAVPAQYIIPFSAQAWQSFRQALQRKIARKQLIYTSNMSESTAFPANAQAGSWMWRMPSGSSQSNAEFKTPFAHKGRREWDSYRADTALSFKELFFDQESTLEQEKLVCYKPGFLNLLHPQLNTVDRNNQKNAHCEIKEQSHGTSSWSQRIKAVYQLFSNLVLEI